jgi:hypothetical protein
MSRKTALAFGFLKAFSRLRMISSALASLSAEINP